MLYCVEGFNQERAVEFGLNVKELIFLRWFLLFTHSGRMKKRFYKEEIYYWVSNRYIIEELPILKLKYPSHVRRFLRGLVEKEILKHFVSPDKEAYYSPVSEKILQLISFPQRSYQNGKKVLPKLVRHELKDYNPNTIKDILKNLKISNGKVL